MMKRKLHRESYPENSVEQRILTPVDYGIPEIDSVSYSHYTKYWKPMPLHVHPGCLEACFCLRGSLKFECEDKNYTLLPGNMFISQPNDTHRLLTNHKGVICYWIRFRYPSGGTSVLRLPKRESDTLVRSLRKISNHLFAADSELVHIFRVIFKSVDMPGGPMRTLTYRTLFGRLLLLIVKSSSNVPGLQGLARITSIARIMEKRPTHRFTITELAQHARLSESRFTALFRQVMGLPPYAYLTSCRMNEVKRRLKKTSDSIAEIARDLGFVSAQHLAMQFRKTFGLTASEFRSNPTPAD